MTTATHVKAAPQTATPAKKTVATKSSKPVATKPSPVVAKAAATSAPVVSTPAKANTAVKKAAPKAVKPAKVAKVKKVKMVRDSMSIPKDEYAVLQDLKLRANKLGMPVKKTEVLRAGIKTLAALPDAALLASLKAVPSLKTGRPAKSA